MDLQYVENFTGGTVVMLVYGEIGGEKGVNGAQFAQVIQYLQGDPEVLDIEVRVNSHGGGVLDALNIFNAIRGSKKPCRTIIDGIAASSGGLVAMAGHTRAINDFGRLMVHAPSVPDKAKETLNENTVKMLDQFQDLIADLLTANSKHEKSEVVTMINGETWFNANQALEAGFVDEVINTGRQFDEVFNGLDFETSELSLVVNNFNRNPKNIIKMKLVKNTLGLDENVSEQVVNETIATIVNEKATADKALETEQKLHGETKTALKTATDKVTEINNSAAVSFVENAIKEGKFAPEAKEALISQAKNDLKGFKTLCESMATPAKKITDKIDTKGDAKAGEVVNGKLDGKTFRELEKSSPQVIVDLLANDPEKHAALFAAQYPNAK